MATLRALGAPVQTADDAVEAGRQRVADLRSRPIEPVVVAWQGRGDFELRLPASKTPGRVSCHLQLEDGPKRSWTISQSGEVNRHRFPTRLPLGYHLLRVEIGRRTHQSLVVSAPLRAFEDASETWGCFLPLHALHTTRSWGIGDFSDLAALADWMDGEGGQVVSTLPLLACFLGDAPFEPSPYLPVSRLFWNEVFIDPRKVPEFADCAAARRLVESPVFEKEIATLRNASIVDYRRVMQAKRQVLELLVDSLARRRGVRRHALERWARQHDLANEYAAFRAAGERLGRPWSMWPDRLTPDALGSPRADRGRIRYHLYVQWLAAAQLDEVAARARTVGEGLYLDSPLGVHPEGFDVWRYPQLFAREASAGAPPDELFARGQNWTTPPPHPETARQDGYRYFRAGLARQLEKSGMLRIDHVMALNRLYWIPRGFESTDGVYVHYPADELYAILCLESRRHRTPIIGENLGTVPRYVNERMTRHGLRKLYVAQFNVNRGPGRPLRSVPARALACVNTHDTPTFKGFTDGADIDDRLSRGIVEPREARRAHTDRRAAVAALRRLPGGAADSMKQDARGVLGRCLAHLARSRASLVMVNLEDLWLEASPQNVPGTVWERPNWRRKSAHGLEAFASLRQVSETLRVVARGRATGRRRRRPRSKAAGG